MKLAASNMIDTAVGTMVRVQKGSRGYTYEEITIRIPRILWRNILSFFPSWIGRARQGQPPSPTVQAAEKKRKKNKGKTG